MCVDCFCHFFYGGYYDVPWMNAAKMAKKMQKMAKKNWKDESLLNI